jgi:signal peptidase I
MPSAPQLRGAIRPPPAGSAPVLLAGSCSSRPLHPRHRRGQPNGRADAPSRGAGPAPLVRRRPGVRPARAPYVGQHRAGGPVRRSAAAKVRAAFSRWTGAVACVLLFVLVASVAGWLPWQIMRVGSDSMEPTLSSGAVVLVDRWSDGVDRMDVVVVDPPDAGGAPLVKRAVAVGGDEIAIEDGVLVVNGSPVCEPAIDPALIDAQYFGPLTVPAGELFLLGDSRESSVDSRAFGTVGADQVRGRLAARIWPSPGGLGVGSC